MYGKTLADFPERLEAFTAEFKGADLALLESAFSAARAGCREFPTPADVRRFYTSAAEVPHEPTKRDATPTNWNGMGVKLGVSHEDVQDWLEAGKMKQQEHIARLESDPEWHRMKDRLRGEQKTTWKTPEERAEWATKKAKENGWIA